MEAPATTPRRTLVVLCAASLCWAFSFGLGAPLASLWLRDRACGATVIGLNTSLYYLGIAVAALLVPYLMRRWGNSCAVAGMVASGVTVALFPWAGGLVGYHLLRLLNGIAGAMSLIPLETRVNHNAEPAQRARDFGCYAFCIALGMALGTLVGMQMYDAAPRLAFVQGGLFAVAAAVVVFGWLPAGTVAAEGPQRRTPLAFRRNFLSFGSAWSQGFLEGGMVALLPIYLAAIGITEGGMGWMMSGIMVGVIAFQVPVAWLADRLGRTRVLLGCYAVAALGLALVPLGVGTFWLMLWLFLVGACSGAFYPLGLAILGQRLPAESVPRANAWYLAINCVGSLIGPTFTGALMDRLGRGAMFGAGEAAVLAVVAVWAVLAGYDLWRGRGARPETTAALETRAAA
ncbi:MAG TPA: MFS transporter [Gemmataceae bacterium]|nr:MFS transporter [Gemmataceae bacterium]